MFGMTYLRTRLVSENEWRKAHAKTGSLYFIRDPERACVKIGHSRDPWKRHKLPVDVLLHFKWSGNDAY